MADFSLTHFTTADGLQLAADIGGPEGAPLVVLMHGGGQTRHSWAKAMHALAEAGYRVVNLDSRGHGDSGWSPEGAYSPSARVLDLRAVVDGSDVPFATVGASMGGITSIQAVGEGVRPSALILVDIVPQMEPKGVGRIVGFMNANHDGFASLEEAADAVAAYYPERPRPKNPAGLMKNLRKHDDGRLYWHWDPRQFNIEDPGNFKELIAQSTQILGQCDDIDVLVVRGMLSDMVSQRGIDAFCETVPAATVIDIELAGHMVAGDRNDAFNASVIEFLRDRMPA